MTAVAQELEETLERLEPGAAKQLEKKVRADILQATELARALEEIKLRKPEFADIIGLWADVEFEVPPDLPLPPAKIW